MKKSRKPKTILLVEDEEITLLSEKTFLEQNGYRVIPVTNGEEAVKAAKKRKGLDLVLMDIDLGSGMTGTDAARLILQEKDIPLIFLSAHTEKELVEKTETISSYGYIVKSADNAVMLASIRMAFRLFDSRNLYQKTFNNSINGLCLHKMLRDDQGHSWDCQYISVNPAFEKHTGLKWKELPGKTIREIYPGHVADDVINLYGKVVDTGIPRQEEIYFEGTERWYFLSIFSLENDYFTVVVQNINQMKETEEALRLSEKNYRTLFEDHAAVKLIIDPYSGAIHDANNAAADFYGWSREKLASMRIQDISLFSDDDVSEAIHQAEHCIKNFFESRHRCANGAVKHVNVYSTPINLQGKTFLDVIVFDLTSHFEKEKKLEEARENIKQRLHETRIFQDMLLEAIPVPVFYKDREGRYLGFNTAFENFFGEKREKMVGKSVYDLSPADLAEIYHQKDIELIENGGTQVYQSQVETPANRRYDVIFSKSAIQDSLGTPAGLVGVIQDITKRLKDEQTISQLLGEKELLLKEVHHRMKNNMASIESLLRMQMDRMEQEEAKAALSSSLNHVASLRILYDNLILSEDFQEISAADYMESLIASIFSLYPRAQEITVKKELGVFSLNNKILFLLGLVTNELVTNIMKYAFPEDRKGTIEIALRKTDYEVTLVIADDGKGLPDEPKKKKHQSFGLQLVSIITKQLNASWVKKSVADKGTRNTITFAVSPPKPGTENPS